MEQLKATLLSTVHEGNFAQAGRNQERAARAGGGTAGAMRGKRSSSNRRSSRFGPIDPVAQAVQSGVFASPIVAADDSHLKTSNKAAKHGAYRGHLWCFVGTDGTVGGRETVAYGYTKSWEATEIADWFSSIEHFIQVDGNAGC